jgi:hypothetical protein
MRLLGLHVFMSLHLQSMEPKRMMVIGTKIYLMHQGSGREVVDVGIHGCKK